MLCDALLCDACCLRQCRARRLLTLNRPASTAPHRMAPMAPRRAPMRRDAKAAAGQALGGRQSGRRRTSAHAAWLGLAARGRTGGTLARPRGTRRALRGRSATTGAALARSNQTALRDGPGPLNSCGERTWTGYRTLARGRLYVCIRARMAAAAAPRGVRLRMGRGASRGGDVRLLW
jgi:hypothetical protein